MTAPDPRAWLDQVDARTNAATDGPWVFGTGPDPEYPGTPAEWIAGALTGDHPLYLTWCETPPEEYGVPTVIPALTGDGPNARANAEFIASARTDLPAATTALRAVLDLLDGLPGHRSVQSVNPADIRTAITTALEDA